MTSPLKTLALLIPALLASAAALAQPAPRTIRVATPFAAGHILADTALKFKEELERRAPHITVQVVSGLLNEQSINPAAKACAADARVAEVVFTGGQPIQDYAPQYFFFNGPYVIRDFKHLQNVWQSKIGQSMSAQIEQNGNFVPFEPVYRGFRQFTSHKPINTPADFSGLKLRLPPAPDWIAVWSSLGVTPVTVPLNGIYSALQNGTAEASEGDLTQIQSLKLHEVQRQLTLTNHLVGFGMPLSNACFYRNELSADERSRFNSAMQQAVAWGGSTMQGKEAALQSQLAAAGMTVTTPDAAAIRRAAEPAINTLFATRWTVTTWADILAR